jgi:two-component system sensor histidine kinase UhpB
MPELFSSDGFMPHGHCYLWKPGLVWLHLTSDLLIALAYTTIPFTLVYFIRKRKDVPFRWIFLWFGLFIVSCGGTHAFEAWNLYHADYWLAGLGKAFTAVASLVTAFLLVRIVPEAITLPSREELRQANAGLRLAHAELSESRRWLIALFENALDAIFVADDGGRYVEANPAAAELLGYSRDELRSLSLRDVTPLADRESVPESWRAFRERGAYSGESRLLRKDGVVRDVELRSVANIIPGLHVAIARDISDRKRAEDKLRRKERLFEEAEEVAHVGCWEWDLESDSLIWSAENYRLFGVSPDEFVPDFESFQDKVHPDDRAFVVELNKRTISEGGSFAYDSRIVRPSGELRFMHARGHAVRNQDGRVVRLIGIAQDITDRRREEEVRRSLLNRLLSGHEEEQARISRELHDGPGQSLAAAMVGLRRIQDATSLKKAKETAAQHRELLAQVIEELGRLARGLRPTVLDDLGLHAALERHAADIARYYGLDVRLEAKALGRLPRDFETTLYRTVQEALSNTARHARARHVWISVLREDGTVGLTVTDDGCGFEMGPAQDASGHLGLQGIRERATLLGGRAEILSRPGKGTTVTVTLPLPAAAWSRTASAPGRARHRRLPR